MGVTVYPSPTIPVDVTNTSLATTSGNNFYLDVSKGLVSGHEIIHKFGRNPTLASATWEGVLELSTDFTWLQAATTVRVKAGGNTNDTAAGSGAQAVTIEGLNASGNHISESVSLAGASASASTSNSFLRVYRAYVSQVGTYTGNNDGNIVIENTAGTSDLIQITADLGQSQYCAYSIPTGKTGYLLSVVVQADAAKAADFRLMTRENLTDVTTPFSPARLKYYWDGVLGVQETKPLTPMLKLSALTDIWIDAQGGAAGTEVSADMEILLIDN